MKTDSSGRLSAIADGLWMGRSPMSRATVMAAVLATSACGSSQEAEEPSGMGGAGMSATAGSGGANAGASGAGRAGSGGGAAGSGDCEIEIVQSPPASATHLGECTAIEYDTNPPSGGDHYGAWPAFQSYDFAVPAGYLVHALEHGAVVFWYNCPDGCPAEVAEVEAFISGLPQDPACAGTSADRRVILVPSPELHARWAASAWGFALTASCFDAEAFEGFYLEHYAQGREDLCAAGQAFTENPCP